MINFLSSFIYIISTVFDLPLFHHLIIVGAGGYSDIYVSDVVIIKSAVGVFKKLRRVVTRFRRQ
jgi:hypothetical protein